MHKFYDLQNIAIQAKNYALYGWHSSQKEQPFCLAKQITQSYKIFFLKIDSETVLHAERIVKIFLWDENTQEIKRCFFVIANNLILICYYLQTVNSLIRDLNILELEGLSCIHEKYITQKINFILFSNTFPITREKKRFLLKIDKEIKKRNHTIEQSRALTIIRTLEKAIIALNAADENKKIPNINYLINLTNIWDDKVFLVLITAFIKRKNSTNIKNLTNSTYIVFVQSLVNELALIQEYVLLHIESVNHGTQTLCEKSQKTSA